MKWEEWRFSAKLAWQDRIIKWPMVLDAILMIGASCYMLVRLVPEGMRSGMLSLHYTIYLGIDEVQPWPWIMLLPGLMIFVWLANFLVALGVYRGDHLAAKTLVAIYTLTNIIWIVCLFFLVIINI